MTRIAASLVALLVIFDAGEVHAQLNETSKAGYLLRHCERYLDEKMDYFTGYCMGRVSGAIWGSYGNDKPVACIPEDVNNDQLIRVFVKHAQENSGRLHEVDIALLFEAARKAWPCKGRK